MAKKSKKLKSEISVTEFRDKIFEHDHWCQRFKSGTGHWPVDEPWQWFAWALELFGREAIDGITWQRCADLIYGKLSRERDQKLRELQERKKSAGEHFRELLKAEEPNNENLRAWQKTKETLSRFRDSLEEQRDEIKKGDIKFERKLIELGVPPEHAKLETDADVMAVAARAGLSFETIKEGKFTEAELILYLENKTLGGKKYKGRKRKRRSPKWCPETWGARYSEWQSETNRTGITIRQFAENKSWNVNDTHAAFNAMRTARNKKPQESANPKLLSSKK